MYEKMFEFWIHAKCSIMLIHTKFEIKKYLRIPNSNEKSCQNGYKFNVNQNKEFS